MLLFEQNLLKLNNGQFAKFSHRDDWYRMIFTFEDGKKYCLLDEVKFYSISPMGEPDCPLKEEYQPKNIKLFDPADKDTQDVISVDDWEDYFEPVQYEENEDDKKFSDFQEAVKYVEKHIIQKPYDNWNGVDETLCNKPYQHIWSIVEGDNGKLILLNGYHKCNVLDYLVCKTPWGTGEDSDADVYLEVKYEDI
jgi:hypothetical protein